MSFSDGEAMPVQQENTQKPTVLASRRSLWTGLRKDVEVWITQVPGNVSPTW